MSAPVGAAPAGEGAGELAVRQGEPERRRVELAALPTQSHPECTIELEGRRGKLRICVNGAPASYLAALSRELWESAS